MKAYELTCSVDAVDVDYSETLFCESEPDYWTCDGIASAHGCEYWTIYEIEPDEAEALYLMDVYNTAEDAGKDPAEEIAAVLPFCACSAATLEILTCENYHTLNRIIDALRASCAA